VTCVGEHVLVLQGSRRTGGLHFAFDERHLTNWDDGSEIGSTERDRIVARVLAALEFMKITHTFDRK
jgi:hypothetical protein